MQHQEILPRLESLIQLQLVSLVQNVAVPAAPGKR
jgi:hypothetical protein